MSAVRHDHSDGACREDLGAASACQIKRRIVLRRREARERPKAGARGATEAAGREDATGRPTDVA
jgi:hypothetical protein